MVKEVVTDRGQKAADFLAHGMPARVFGKRTQSDFTRPLPQPARDPARPSIRGHGSLDNAGASVN